MKNNYHIVIVGAGIVGLISAALLGKSAYNNKYHIHVIDAENQPNYKDDKEVSLRVSALSRGSIDILECLGVWQEIKEKRAYPYENMQVWDAHPRVYLAIEKTGHSICPYCDAHFHLCGDHAASE